MYKYTYSMLIDGREFNKSQYLLAFIFSEMEHVYVGRLDTVSFGYRLI